MKTKLNAFFVLVGLVSAFTLSAAPPPCSTYSILRNTIDAGGGLSRSADYVNVGSLRSVGGMPAPGSGSWSPTLPIFEPFGHPLGPLIGQTAPGGWLWVEAGSPGPEQPSVEAGALQYVGLAYAIPNRVELRAGSGPSARLPFADAAVAPGASGGPLTSGTILFSFVLRVPDPSGLSADGDYFAALTPSAAAEPDTPSEAYVRVLLRPATGGYNVGVVKSSDDPADFLWDSRLWDTNINVLVVGAYTFEPSTGDDVAQLWVSPGGPSFCNAVPPPTLLASTAGADATALASFVYFQRPAPNLPARLWSDELRLGCSWLNVVEPGADWGDALVLPFPPPRFPTLAADNGASHTVVPGIHLGRSVDVECDGSPSPFADGDDTSGLDDEEGLLTTVFQRGTPSVFTVEASCAGFLNVWMDLNRDWDWLDPDEHVFDDMPLVPGPNNLSLTIPFTVLPGPRYARLRFDTKGGLEPTGHADDGEVEDYLIEIVPGVGLVDVGPVRDINLSTDSASPGPCVAMNGVVFFAASSSVFGGDDIELWKSDGTADGTVRVKDINPGLGSSSPTNLTVLDTILYFSANDGTAGVELWKSDGTEAGTVRVKDIYAGAGHSSPASLTVVSNTLFFSAIASGLGRELWKSDGTEAGTVCVKDILAGNGSSSPQYLCPLGLPGRWLLFSASDSAYGLELWKTDGTSAGTELVKDIRPGTAYSQPQFLTRLGDLVFFWADDGTSGMEPWKSDGTSAGTVMVKDILPGSSGTSPSRMAVVGTTLFFRAFDTTFQHGNELWKSDGTPEGTTLVKDIQPGGGSSNPDYLTPVGSRLFFSAADSVGGRELWITDGTEDGTQRVKDIAPGTPSSDPHALVAFGNTLLFAANDGPSGIELWKSDGTGEGTVRVRDIRAGAISSSPDFLFVVGDKVLFSAYESATGAELWTSDGTESGTVLVRDINQAPQSSTAGLLTAVGETVFFVADDAWHGAELWKTDGTPSGTRLVKDILPGGLSSSPAELTAVGNTLFFCANEGTNGEELWKSDGTEEGTVLVKDIRPGSASSSIEFMTAVGDTVFFSANDGVSGKELWKSDGTEVGTVRVKDIASGGPSSIPEFLTAVGNTLFFTASTSEYWEELWKSDGTEAGTVLVKDIKPGPDRSTPEELTAVDSRLFFRAMDTVGSAGYELWVSDGTEPGTYRVKDIWPGSNGSTPLHLTALGNTLFFVANDSVNGAELWRSDGTEAGTFMVKNINPQLHASIDDLTAVGSRLFFRANDGTTAHELWTSDGTAAGTVLVKDIWPGWSSFPQFITALGSYAFFNANDGIHGEELWMSDGTDAGTVLVGDLYAGSAGSAPENLVAVGNRLIFTATEPSLGNELWQMVVTRAPEADLQVVLDPVPTELPEGDLLLITATASNAGPSTATSVQLSFTLPPGAILQSITSSQGSCDVRGSNVQCGCESLAPGGSVVVHLTLATEMLAPGAGEFENLGDLTALVSAAEPDLNPTNNQVHAAVVVFPNLDFGDARLGYPVTRAENGARHLNGTIYHMGLAFDREPDGVHSALADADDTTGVDDEDGVAVPTPLLAGRTHTVTVTLPVAGFLDAFFDWNNDGDWDDPDERVTPSAGLAIGPGSVSVPVPVPLSAVPGTPHARLRFSDTGGLGPTGFHAVGEVEDLAVEVRLAPPCSYLCFVRKTNLLDIVNRGIETNVLKLFRAAADPTSNRLYVTGILTEDIGVLNTALQTWEGTLNTGDTGHKYVWADPVNRYLCVANATHGSVRTIDLDTHATLAERRDLRDVLGCNILEGIFGGAAVDTTRGRFIVGTPVPPYFRAFDGVTLHEAADFTNHLSVPSTLGFPLYDPSENVIYTFDREDTSTNRAIYRLNAADGQTLARLAFQAPEGQRVTQVARNFARRHFYFLTEQATNRTLLVVNNSGVTLSTNVLSPNREVADMSFDPVSEHLVLLTLASPTNGSVQSMGGFLDVYDTVALTNISSLAFGRRPESLAYDAGHNRFYCPNGDASRVWSFDPPYTNVTGLRLGDSIEQVVPIPGTGVVYLNSRLGGSYLIESDVLNNTNVIFESGTWPIPLRTDASGQRLFVLNAWDSSLAIYDLHPSRTLVTNVSLGLPPGTTDRIPEMEVDAMGHRAFIVYPEFARLVVVDTTNYTVVHSERLAGFPDGAQPQGPGQLDLAFNEALQCLYVLRNDTNRMLMLAPGRFTNEVDLSMYDWSDTLGGIGTDLLFRDETNNRLFAGPFELDPTNGAYLGRIAPIDGNCVFAYDPETDTYWTLGVPPSTDAPYFIAALDRRTLALRHREWLTVNDGLAPHPALDVARRLLYVGFMARAELHIYSVPLRPSLPVYEIFDYPPSTSLIGQTHPSGVTWVPAGPPGPQQPTIVNGRLQHPGLPYAPPNRVTLQPGNGPSARLPFASAATPPGTPGGPLTNDCVYFCFVLRIQDITGLSSSGSSIAAFTVSPNPESTTPTEAFVQVWLRPAVGGYNLGLSKSIASSSSVVWDSRSLAPLLHLLIVGKYTFGAGADVARLWVNPLLTRFCTTEPAPTAESSAGADAPSLASFVFFQRPAPSLPAMIYLDELRLGRAWLDVVAPGLDFGDAGPPYPTLNADDGPRHTVTPGYSLGHSADVECNGLPSADATGDDLNGTSDEDGLLTKIFEAGTTCTFDVVASASGKLDAWIDWNRNGSWLDAGDQVFTNQSLAAGTNHLALTVPSPAALGTTFARLRFSSAGGLAPTGIAADGEIEDHQVQILRGPEVVSVLNPTSGVSLYCHIHRPTSFDPKRTYPGLVLVPGAGDDGSAFDVGYHAQTRAELGFIVMHFDPDGRGLSTAGGTYTNEDCGGPVQQDGLRAVLQSLVDLPETDDLNIGVQSSSFGVFTASGALARYPNNPSVKFLLDWEGPADRTDTGAVPHDPFDDVWWGEREATGFVTNFGGYYLRVQSEVDHVQSNNVHAIKLVNRAAHTRHGGLGRCVWTRVNSATGVTANLANAVYWPPTPPPEWIAESVSTEPMLEQYLLELAAMPPLGPTLVCPASVRALAPTPAGATVSFTVTATDPWDPSPVVVCVPASGSLFPIGLTTVTCTATDDSGNIGTSSFPVEVVELMAVSTPTGLTVTWHISGVVLEVADAPTGPWRTVPEARSPLSVAPTDPAKFYRLRYIEGARVLKVEPSIILPDGPVGSEVHVFGLNTESNHLVRLHGTLLAEQTVVEPNVLRGRVTSSPAGLYDVELVDGLGAVLAVLKGGLEAAVAPVLRTELPPSVPSAVAGQAATEGAVQRANGECMFSAVDLNVNAVKVKGP